MARNARGQFLPGPDPDRYQFTKEECKAAYEAAVEAIRKDLGHAGDYTARRVLAKRMNRTEARRYGLPEPPPACARPQMDGQDRKGRDYRNPAPAYMVTHGGD
jgi:hypothetical protein